MLFMPQKPFQPALSPHPNATALHAFLLPFKGHKLLVHEANPGYALIKGFREDLPFSTAEKGVFLGYLDKIPCWAYDVNGIQTQPASYAFINLRRLFDDIGQDHFILASRALQTINWSRDFRFCSRCASPLEDFPEERARRCPNCQLSAYPRISPAVIVGIRRDNKMLLARSPRFPKGIYSVLAGFCEAGESLEETLHREVFEEVNIRIQNLRYFSSQSWPFPNSLMIGFIADYHSGDIKVDGVEIEDAGWFDIDDLPVTPSRISISRAIIAHIAETIRMSK